MNIVLIGYRGSGKSSIGQLLAKRLGLEFVDTDVLLVERAGRTIKAIFEAEGEEGFRNRESAAIAEASGRAGCVIAAGGGAVLRPGNVAALKKGGTVVWLEAPAEVLYERIRADRGTAANRPNLTAKGGLEEVRALLAARMPLYEAAADWRLDISELTVEEAVGRLWERFRGK